MKEFHLSEEGLDFINQYFATQYLTLGLKI